MRTRAALLAALFLAGGVRALAQDCVPSFYNAEPRDADWYYGAGKGADADAARQDALDHLFLKVAGGEADIPRDVLAGWEQDDHGECRGVHYVIDRISKDRARRNMADALKRKPSAAPAPAVSSTVLVNNINIAAPAPLPRDEDRGLKYLVLLALFLAFLVAVIAFLRRSGPAPYVPGPSRDVVSDPKPRRPPPPSALKEEFAAVARQPQAEAMAEIATKGVLAYLKDHKGEGTCKSVPGTAELVFAGVEEMARRYQAQDWKVHSEKWSCFAVKADGGVAMGFAFYVYASKMSGYVDVEIFYAIGAGIQDSYRKTMEESLHQGLPWTVQAVAMRQGAARSRDDAA